MPRRFLSTRCPRLPVGCATRDTLRPYISHMPTAVVLLCLLTLACGGCHRSLFSEDLPRHQFEDYDTARTGSVPMDELDEFGHPRPNLRKRLTGQ
jgi:hypothetical protein